MIVTRTLQQINDDIKEHEASISALKKEIYNFQSNCPHPSNFEKVQRKSVDDEYGRRDYDYTIRTCLLCGRVEHRNED